MHGEFSATFFVISSQFNQAHVDKYMLCEIFLQCSALLTINISIADYE